MGSAAVCAYSQEDLQEVFEGKYKELNKESSRWTVYSGSNMSPRPGSVSADAGPHGGGFVRPGLLWGEVVAWGSICTKTMLWGIPSRSPSSPGASASPRSTKSSLPAVLHGSLLRQSPHLHEGSFPDGREGVTHPGTAAAGEDGRHLHAHRGG